LNEAHPLAFPHSKNANWTAELYADALGVGALVVEQAAQGTAAGDL
jgi:hypothetical protein